MSFKKSCRREGLKGKAEKIIIAKCFHKAEHRKKNLVRRPSRGATSIIKRSKKAATCSCKKTYRRTQRKKIQKCLSFHQKDASMSEGRVHRERGGALKESSYIRGGKKSATERQRQDKTRKTEAFESDYSAMTADKAAGRGFKEGKRCQLGRESVLKTERRIDRSGNGARGATRIF